MSLKPTLILELGLGVVCCFNGVLGLEAAVFQLIYRNFYMKMNGMW